MVIPAVGDLALGAQICPGSRASPGGAAGA